MPPVFHSIDLSLSLIDGLLISDPEECFRVHAADVKRAYEQAVTYVYGKVNPDEPTVLSDTDTTETVIPDNCCWVYLLG